MDGSSRRTVVTLSLAMALLLGTPVGSVAMATGPTSPPVTHLTSPPEPASERIGRPADPAAVGTTVDRVASTTEATAPGGPNVHVTARRTSGSQRNVVYDVTVTGVANASELWILTDEATGDGLVGLDRADADRGRYRWNGSASTARVRLTPRGDRSADGSLSLAGREWAFAPVPVLVVAWRTAEGDVRRVRPFADRASDRVDVETVDGGVVGEKFALLGWATVHERELESGRVRLAVPGTVEPRAGQAAVLEVLAGADATFDDGAGRGDVLVFVLPDRVRDGGATFVSRDETWVAADSPLDAANNVWLHEYVHTRQSFDLGPRMAWFGEASAEYFGARLARETGQASRLEYEAYLLGRQAAAAPLTDRERWPATDHPYHRGTRVLAALDGEIRVRTSGERSLEDVFRRLNRHDGVVTYEVFVRVVGAVAGEDLSPWLDRHVDGTATVRRLEPPTRSQVADIPGAESASYASVVIGVALLGGTVLRRW